MFRKYVEKHIFRACVCEKKKVILQRKMKGTTRTQAQPNTKAAKPKARNTETTEDLRHRQSCVENAPKADKHKAIIIKHKIL